MNAQLCTMVAQLIRLGPNINEVAGRLGIHKETVRYRFKHLLLNRGFTLHAVPSYKRLGLDHMILIAGFASSFRPHAATILAEMHEVCYVTGVEQTAVEGWFIIRVAVPGDQAESCQDLFEQLKILGIFSYLEIFKFQFVRTPPMKYEAFDFEKGVWTYEWPLRDEKVPLHLLSQQMTEPYDRVDLMILKELQADANTSLIQISKRVGMGYRKLTWHHTNHVLGNGLIDSYSVNWRGGNSDSDKEGTLANPRKYLALCLFLTNADEGSRLSLMALIQRLPFLWFEAFGPDYFASLYLPPETINEFFSHLRDLNIDAGKLRYFITNESSTLNFGISYHLFDGASRKWQLNKPNAIKKFQNLLLKVSS